jgi:hypothetical protein
VIVDVESSRKRSSRGRRELRVVRTTAMMSTRMRRDIAMRLVWRIIRR